MNRILETLVSTGPIRSVPPSTLPTLDELVGEYILMLLALTHHNISQTARILNISRTTLYNRLRRQSS
ncbi:MAG: helix-turn-helix domain-containing protein [Acidobacteriota bacterium]|jgi:transcriptional regulator of acetoin/glycerol metabolism|nr:helix-turn-helix domain-containing protein [Acidobacteriota bacterium]HNT31218.1 helix-turn-helix domain-containing protein [Candidatus Aminicenantes bacterium]MDD8011325.1 helix-turn-helix domain-containing protein [Acidobacteriota bacterium]MDD8030027.1 helix-turn-helix domain-containing protein [Acidobacteriota bacterium]MDD8032630.1 helix-turn-helix domain-containing protein [Acidobacteriota bacterium]